MCVHIYIYNIEKTYIQHVHFLVAYIIQNTVPPRKPRFGHSISDKFKLGERPDIFTARQQDFRP